MQPKLHSFRTPGSETNPSHNLAYAEWVIGTPKKIIVCVHGLTRNSRDFDFLAQGFQNVRVLAPDMAGRGRSDRLADPARYNYGTYYADLLAWLDHCKISTCQWVGTSMGGILGMMMAALNPDRISALVLNDIGITVAKEGLKRICNYVGHNGIFLNMQQAQAHLRSIMAPFGIMDEAHWQDVFAHSIVQKPDGSAQLSTDPTILSSYKKETAGFTKIEDIDLSNFWNVITCPTLVLRGEHSDILRKETFNYMRTKAGVAAKEFAGIGHAPSLMNPQEITVVADWLAKQP